MQNLIMKKCWNEKSRMLIPDKFYERSPNFMKFELTNFELIGNLWGKDIHTTKWAEIKLQNCILSGNLLEVSQHSIYNTTEWIATSEKVFHQNCSSK